MGINNVISLLGGVALFLFGMTLMGDGLKKVAGNKLEIILYKLTSTPLKGVLLGTGVTAVIQSSSATSVMVVGFVNSGMMQVRQAIGIVLGSILGTSITGWILCLSDISGSGWVSLLSTATLTGVVAVVGIVLRMFCRDLTKHHIGDILLGFAVLMYGMSSMSQEKLFPVNFTSQRSAVNNYPTFLLQIVSAPDVMISNEEMHFNSHIRQFRQFSQEAGITFRNHQFELIPEVKHIPQQINSCCLMLDTIQKVDQPALLSTSMRNSPGT